MAKKFMQDVVVIRMSNKILFVCNSCGYETSKWLGKCPACNEWNTFVEEVISKKPKKYSNDKHPTKSELITEIDIINAPRISTGFLELDMVLGGGIVEGSVNLLGGDPGIGKSTLLLQVCKNLSNNNMKILYASSEESKTQIKMRANRINSINENIYIYSENEISDIINEAEKISPKILIVDSIQTVYSSDGSSTPGTVSQVRECTMQLMRFAKTRNIAVFIVGHMTKEGMIAGPKVLEHIVDCVLYFEGERQSTYRIIRCNKNRFGSSNEIAVFDMQEIGLIEITNPSEIFISGRINGVAGSVVACSLEGSRPILVEVQALVTKTNYNIPKRTGTGIDFNRMSLILAVLDKRAGMGIWNYDVYVNITGGLSVSEPAFDLAIAMAVASGFKNIPITSNCVIFGEIGLLGEIRAVSGIEKRILEAQKLGFKKCIIPYNNLKIIEKNKYDIEIISVKSVIDAFNLGFSS
jgi:DNA repair protein RadA/Sms